MFGTIPVGFPKISGTPVAVCPIIRISVVWSVCEMIDRKSFLTEEISLPKNRVVPV
jgi:hypothetical protein